MEQEEKKFFGLAALGVAAAITLILISSTKDSRLLEALGDALLIAALLAVTVDHYLKKRLVRDVSKYLIGYSLPPQIQDRIHELMSIGLVRKELTFEITLKSHSSNSVLVHLDLSYMVYNLTGRPRSFIHGFEYDTNPELLEMRCDGTDENAKYIQRKDLGNLQTEVLLGGRRKAKNEVTIQPHNEESGTAYRFTTIWEVIETAGSDLRHPGLESLLLDDPTIGVRVIVKYPSGEFVIDPLAVGGKPIDKTSYGGFDANGWEYERLMLVDETIGIRWLKIENNKQPSLKQAAKA